MSSASHADDGEGGADRPVHIDLWGKSIDAARNVLRKHAAARRVGELTVGVLPSYADIATLAREFPALQTTERLVVRFSFIATDERSNAAYSGIATIINALPHLTDIDLRVPAADVDVPAFLAEVDRLPGLERLSFQGFQAVSNPGYRAQALDDVAKFVRGRYKTPGKRRIVQISMIGLLFKQFTDRRKFERELAEMGCNVLYYGISGQVNSHNVENLEIERRIAAEVARFLDVIGVPELTASYLREGDEP